MSIECIDTAISLANRYKKPILLIASRRQIDSEEFGGGYVEGWSTDQFANYVRANDYGKYVILARDHGGPWQNPIEIENNLDSSDAIESAKRSFHADIKAGFEFIHIDTSVDIHAEINDELAIARLVDLYEYCVKTASDYSKEIIVEIGTEEQSGKTNLLEANEFILSKVNEILNRKGLQLPDFIVMQTGTRVHSDKNIGTLDSYERKPFEVPPEISIPQILNLCKRNNIFLKEHNLDYVTSDLLKWHPKLGIHAANVAPEFGVTHTKEILELLNIEQLKDHRSQLIDIAVKSNKWQKWADDISDFLPDRKALLSLHYSFSNPDVSDIINDASDYLTKNGVDLHRKIRNSLSTSINRYLTNFNY